MFCINAWWKVLSTDAHDIFEITKVGSKNVTLVKKDDCFQKSNPDEQLKNASMKQQMIADQQERDIKVNTTVWPKQSSLPLIKNFFLDLTGVTCCWFSCRSSSKLFLKQKPVCSSCSRSFMRKFKILVGDFTLWFCFFNVTFQSLYFLWDLDGKGG